MLENNQSGADGPAECILPTLCIFITEKFIADGRVRTPKCIHRPLSEY
jgi:hypothetical protein